MKYTSIETLRAVSIIQPSQMKEVIDYFFLSENSLALYQAVYFSDVQSLQKNMLGDMNSYFLN